MTAPSDPQRKQGTLTQDKTATTVQAKAAATQAPRSAGTSDLKIKDALYVLNQVWGAQNVGLQRVGAISENSFSVSKSFTLDMAYRVVVSQVDVNALRSAYRARFGRDFDRDFAARQASMAKEQAKAKREQDEQHGVATWEALDKNWLAFLEVAAMDMAYVDSRLSDYKSEQERMVAQARVTLLQHFGLQAMSVVHGTCGFEMRVFIPIPQGKPHHKANAKPIVAFRGSEGSKILSLGDASGRLDFDDDLRSAEVGKRQFSENRELIQHWMKFAHQHGLPAVVGHSLGGALAQLAACAWPEYTGQVATFQAPGINAETIQKLAQFNAKHQNDGRAIVSHHVRFERDLVEHAGYALTPGFSHTFETPATPLMKASASVLQPLLGAVGYGIGGATGTAQALRGKMNVWGAVGMGFKGAATGYTMGGLLPYSGEHTTPGVRSYLLSTDPAAQQLFGKTAGVGKNAKYVSSAPVNDLGDRRFERLRQDAGPLLATAAFKLPTQWIESKGGGLDTTNPQYVNAHQQLSQIARAGKDREQTIRAMRSALDQLLPRTSKYHAALGSLLGQIWRNWHPEVER